MIARTVIGKAGQRSVRYIALRLQTRSDALRVWIPVGGGVCGIAEDSRAAAARACIRCLNERFRLLRTDISRALAPSPGRFGGTASPEQLRQIQIQVVRLHHEAARLLDAPDDNDVVEIDEQLKPAKLTRYQLRAARVMAGLGLRELAKLSGHTIAAIQAIESGATRRPRPATIESLHAALTAVGVEFDRAGWVRYRGDSVTAPNECTGCHP